MAHIIMRNFKTPPRIQMHQSLQTNASIVKKAALFVGGHASIIPPFFPQYVHPSQPPRNTKGSSSYPSLAQCSPSSTYFKTMLPSISSPPNGAHIFHCMSSYWIESFVTSCCNTLSIQFLRNLSFITFCAYGS